MSTQGVARDRTGPGRPRGGRPGSRRRGGRWLEEGAKRALLPLAGFLWPARPETPRPLDQAGQVLIVRQDNRLGNLVLLSPFLVALRALAPQARVVFLAGDRYAEILDDFPWIDERLVLPKRWMIGHPHRVPGYLRGLSRRGWDIVFEVSNPDTHSFTNALLTLASRAPARVGFAHPRSRGALSLAVAPPLRECHYSLAPLLLLSALGAQPPLETMRLSPALTRLAGEAAAGAEPAVVIHPGARGSKRWPTECFERLIAGIASLRPECPVRLIGGPAERDLLVRLAGRDGGRIEARVLDSLPALVRALGGARVYISCDAGPMHVAAALQVPVLALFLASHPLRYAPLGERHETILLGERSRALAGQERFPACEEPRARGAGGHAAPWDARFHDRVTAMRPACVRAKPGLGPAGEADFVLERLAALLERVADARGSRADRG